MTRYTVFSASGKTEDWPFWFVADNQKGGVNCTADLIRQFYNPDHRGGVFTSRAGAEALSEKGNAE